MKTIKKAFTVIELTIALAIIAIGLITVMGSFPLVSDSKAKTKINYYVSDLADNMQSYVNRKAAQNWDTIILDLPEVKPTSELVAASVIDNTGDTSVFIPQDGNKGVYAVKVATLTADGEMVESLGEALVWRTRLGEIQFGSTTIDVGLNKGIGLNLEISLPVDKPYAQREKYTYYFEVFNHDVSVANINEEDYLADVINSNSPDDIITRDEIGEIQVAQAGKKIKVTVLETEFYNDTIPIYARINVKQPSDADSTGTEYTLLNPESSVVVYDSTANEDKPTWEMNVEEGTTFTIRAHGEGNKLYGPYWSTNENQVLTLINGDTPPMFTPGNGQISPAEVIKDYINVETGQVELGSNQVIYLFEIGQTIEFWQNGNRNSGFDRQDVVLLAEIEDADVEEEESAEDGKSNNGHGNNEDGVDMSNPGNSKDGEDTDPTVDDEIKKGKKK